MLLLPLPVAPTRPMTEPGGASRLKSRSTGRPWREQGADLQLAAEDQPDAEADHPGGADAGEEGQYGVGEGGEPRALDLALEQRLARGGEFDRLVFLAPQGADDARAG